MLALTLINYKHIFVRLITYFMFSYCNNFLLILNNVQQRCVQFILLASVQTFFTSVYLYVAFAAGVNALLNTSISPIPDSCLRRCFNTRSLSSTSHILSLLCSILCLYRLVYYESALTGSRESKQGTGVTTFTFSSNLFCRSYLVPTLPRLLLHLHAQS